MSCVMANFSAEPFREYTQLHKSAVQKISAGMLCEMSPGFLYSILVVRLSNLNRGYVQLY